MSDIDTTPGRNHPMVALADVAAVVESATPADIEAFAVGLQPAYAIAWLARAIDFADGLNTFLRTLQARLATDPTMRAAVGNGWKDPQTNHVYEVKVGGRSGWTDVPGLYDEYLKSGGSLASFIGAISDLRVTDLRAAANTLPAEKKKALLEAIGEFRGFKPSAPKLGRVDEE